MMALIVMRAENRMQFTLILMIMTLITVMIMTTIIYRVWKGGGFSTTQQSRSAVCDKKVNKNVL